jgi:hypothetical protein
MCRFLNFAVTGTNCGDLVLPWRIPDILKNGEYIGAETAMNASEEFRKHAAECKPMAQSTRGRDNKKVWIEMTDRWLVCARFAEDEYSARQFRSEEHSS